MKDFEKQVEKLERDAAECELIAQLATDESKRQTFHDLATTYRKIAAAMKTAMTSYKPKATADPPDR